MPLPWTEEALVFMSQPALDAREPSGSVEPSQRPGLEPTDTIFHDANWGGREAKAGHGQVRGLVPLMSLHCWKAGGVSPCPGWCWVGL